MKPTRIDIIPNILKYGMGNASNQDIGVSKSKVTKNIRACPKPLEPPRKANVSIALVNLMELPSYKLNNTQKMHNTSETRNSDAFAAHR